MPGRVFTNQAQKVLDDARDRARYNHNAESVQVPHFLWDLTHANDSVAVRVMCGLGCNLVSIRKNLGQLMETRDGVSPRGRLPVSGLLDEIIQLAAREARASGCNEIDTHHLLIALVVLKGTDPIVSDVLSRYDNLAPENVRTEIKKVLAQTSTALPSQTKREKPKKQKKKTVS